jgi:O-antigen/teichoic acid export membrane protein
MAYIYLFSIFFGVSIHDSVKKEISEGKFNATSCHYFVKGLELKVIISFIASIGLYIGIMFIDIRIIKENFFLFLTLLVLMNIWGSVVTAFESAHRLFYEAIMYFFEYGTKFTLILYFYFTSKLNFQTLLISFIAGYFFATLIGLVIFWKKFEKTKHIITEKITSKILSRALLLGITSIFFTTLQKIDVIIISLFMTIKDVTYYSIAAEISKQSAMISIPIILGAMPIFTAKIIKKAFNSVIKRLFLVNIVILLILLFGSGYIIEVIYGPDYLDVAIIMRILSFLPLLITLQTFTLQILILKDATKEIFFFGLISSVLNILLNYLGVILLGTVGVAIAIVLSYSSWFFMSYFFIKKNYL